MGDLIIRADSVSKKFRIGRRLNPDNFRGVLATIGRMLRRSVSTSDEGVDLWALKDVSFEVQRGEALGIIGGNGAGKSTLLKILSRITGPTAGRIDIWGRAASLLEVGTGFVPALTGRENVFLNGSLLGMSRREIRQRFDQIVEFAEVERFIDIPTQRYSSGMSVRLAFAIAAHLHPALLIVDEVLAVGDARFREKCLGAMRSYVRDGGTVLLVSHDSGLIQSFCRRGLWLKSGRVEMIDDVAPVLSEYASWSRNPARYNGASFQALVSTIDVEENLQGVELMLCPEQGKLVFRVDLIHNWFTEDSIAVAGHTPVEEGRWNCLAVTYGGESSHDSMSLYVNGARETRFDETAGRGLSGRIRSHSPVYLGSRGGQSARFAGDVRLLFAANRCLSADEIAEMTRRTLAAGELTDSEGVSSVDASGFVGAAPELLPLDLNLPFTIVAGVRPSAGRVGSVVSMAASGKE